MTSPAKIIVELTLPQERLDTFLRTHLPDLSRGAIQRLIDEGHITVNGKPVKPTHHPHAGDEIDIHIPEAKPAEAQPEDIPLNVIYEDEDLIVLNKAAGIVVHPAAGHEEHTLVNALLNHCAGKLSGIGGVARPGIVHRLDKDTSGCLVVAKNDTTHLALSKQFADRTMDKVYQAILCGELPKGSGNIRGAIARHPTQRKRMAVVETGGRDAHTSFRVVEKLHGATLVEIGLHTGRTHQIRVHFQHVGFPVVGDTAYGGRHNRTLTEKTGYVAPRQMLHAGKLTLVHPSTGKKKAFEAPLPDDFQQAMRALKK